MKRKDFIESVRRNLMQRRTELLEEVSGDKSLLNSLSANPDRGDVADQASDSLAGEINAHLADVELREIANIDKALCRINDNTYGVCEGCRKNIPLARLEVIPHASVCISCKRIAEDHDFGDASSTDWSSIFGLEDTTSNPDASVS